LQSIHVHVEILGKILIKNMNMFPRSWWNTSAFSCTRRCTQL